MITIVNKKIITTLRNPFEWWWDLVISVCQIHPYTSHPNTYTQIYTRIQKISKYIHTQIHRHTNPHMQVDIYKYTYYGKKKNQSSDERSPSIKEDKHCVAGKGLTHVELKVVKTSEEEEGRCNDSLQVITRTTMNILSRYSTFLFMNTNILLWNNVIPSHAILIREAAHHSSTIKHDARIAFSN